MIIYFLLPALLILSFHYSYTDIKFGKIRNNALLISIIYSLIVYISFFSYSFLSSTINYNFFIQTFTASIFSLIIAFILWDNHIWSAADGKLFFTFSLLIPLSSYKLRSHLYFQHIDFLFNIFIIGCLALLFIIIKNSKIQD